MPSITLKAAQPTSKPEDMWMYHSFLRATAFTKASELKPPPPPSPLPLEPGSPPA